MIAKLLHRAPRIPIAAATVLLAACGGGGQSPSPAPVPPPNEQLVRVSRTSPFAVGCGGGLAGSVLYENAEVEPYVAVNPTSPSNLLGIWQQDRWSDGGAHGLLTAVSFDGGTTWSRKILKVSVCGGGNVQNGGDYARASDPWVSFSPDGIAYAISLSFTGFAFQSGSSSAMLVVRSTDGGQTWSDPVTLIADGSNVLNDKESITADPNDSNYVYAVWDRLTTAETGPAYFARTTDGGQTWEAARSIYDPGANNQTLGNEIAVLPDGTVVDLFTKIVNAFHGTPSATLDVVVSTDRGADWSAPIKIADELAVGAFDPDTGQPIRAGAGLAHIAAGPGGELFVVWEDGRFSNGRRDGIALVHSSDDGATWSTPAQVNGDPAVQAFTPAVTVRDDGEVAVTYYDLRDNTNDPGTLPTDYWLGQSNDLVHWSESRVTGPFDLDVAPDAEGLFLGDYQALAHAGQDFLPFFVKTTTSGTSNRTDVYIAPPPAASAAVRLAVAAGPVEMTPEFRRRVRENLARLVREDVSHKTGETPEARP